MNLKYIHYFEIIYGGCYLLSYFLNILNKKGKKFKSEKYIYQAFILISIKFRENPYLFFFEIIEKTKPVLSIRFKKKKNRKKKLFIIIPTQLKVRAQYKKAIKWLNLALIIQMNRTQYFLKLFYELLNYNIYKESFLIKQKNENYTLIIKNKFNRHYRW